MINLSHWRRRKFCSGSFVPLVLTVVLARVCGHRGNFKGLTYLDKVAGEEKVETRESITIKEAVDSVYYGMTGTVTLVDGDRSVEITPDGDEWTDLVLWNPYGDDKMGYKNFVCIENAVAKDPAVIPVGEYWCSKVSIKPLVNGMPAFLQSLGDD
jgi:hypothetical protein